MPTEKATFPGASGRPLDARLDRPEGTPYACAVLAHCFTCSRQTGAAARLSRALTEQGFGVLRFDFTGLGGGDEAGNADFASNVEDLVAAADWLRGRGIRPRLLVGHSLGGTAALVAAARIEEVEAVATIGAPADPAHVQGLFADDLAAIDEAGTARVSIAEGTFRIHGRLLRDLEEPRLLDVVRRLRKPLLLFHSPVDRVVPIDEARKIFEAAFHPKSFVSLDRADHLLSDPADVDYVAHVLAAWASRYLGGRAAPALEPGLEQEAPDVVRVEAAGEGRLAQRVRIGRHVLRADEPVRLGGQDTGPTPYELLLAALGACTAMTLRLYADREGWPLEDVRVDLRHRKIHASDCASCETQVGMLDRIERRLDLVGPLDEAQRARLREIADRCPVHRTLTSEIVIESL